MEHEIYEIQQKPKGFASLALRGIIGTAALGITGFVAFAGVGDSAQPDNSPVETQAKVLETAPAPEAPVTESASEPVRTTITETSIATSEPVQPADASPVASIGTLAGVSEDDDHWEADDDDDDDHHYEGQERESEDHHEDPDHEDD